MGRLASRRKCILGRKMLFAFACGCGSRFMMFHARPLPKPKSEVQQTWLQQVRCALLWNTSNHIYQTMNFVQQMLCSIHVSTKNAVCVNWGLNSLCRWPQFRHHQRRQGDASSLCAMDVCLKGRYLRQVYNNTLLKWAKWSMQQSSLCGALASQEAGTKIMTVLAHVPCAVCPKAAARWNTKRRRLRNWLFKNLMVPSWMVGSCMWLVEQLQDSVTQIIFKHSPFSWAAG